MKALEKRYILAVFAFFATFNVYSLRKQWKIIKKNIENNINQKFDLLLLNCVHERFIVPLIRNNITVAIIDMTDNPKLSENKPKNILNETVCPLPQKLNTSLKSSENLTINGAIRTGRNFAWTKEWRSLIDLFF